MYIKKIYNYIQKGVSSRIIEDAELMGATITDKEKFDRRVTKETKFNYWTLWIVILLVVTVIVQNFKG